MPATEAVPEPETTQAALLGIYTLTSTHCGTGKAMDAVDLPIAREEHTGHPVLPSSSIKGALRAAAERSKLPGAKAWFGPEINPGASGAKEELYAGSVVFTDARLLAFPVRALHTAFCWVTCPLVLERFHRDLQAFGKTSAWPQKGALHPASDKWDPGTRKAHIAGELAALVLEDLAFSEGEMVVDKDGLKAIAEAFGALLGRSEGVLRCPAAPWFALLVRSSVRRLDRLRMAFGEPGDRPYLEMPALDDVEVVSAQGDSMRSWRDTRKEVPLDGLIGSAVVASEGVRRLMPLLRLLTITNVGKATTMGFGDLAIEELPD